MVAMELDRAFFSYPPSVNSIHSTETEQQEIEIHLRQLYQKQQRLLANLRTNPFQQNEIESQLQAVNRDIQYYRQQQSSYSQYPGSGPITPTTMENPSFPNPNGYNKMSHFMSPVDSAIGSGVTTEAHSVVGDMEDLDQLPDDIPPPNATVLPPQGPPPVPHPNTQMTHLPSSYSSYQNYQDQQNLTNEQVMHTSGDRVRMTVFPDDGEEVPSTQILQDRQTNLQKMSQSSQVLRAAVQNLVNYQSNTELTAKALPEIIALLSHQDQSVIAEAAKLIHDLSKKEPSLQAIIANPNAVRAIIQTLANINNPEIQKPMSGAVHNLSSNSQGLMMIYNCTGIPYLVRLLTSQVDAVLFYAVTTIHNMLLHYEPAKMDVRLAGGLEKMVALLVKDNVKFLAITTDCLHILAYGHQDSKLIILASGGPALLVRIMRIYTYEKLLWTVSRLLKALSVCPSNKPEIVQAGGMQILSMHLGHRSGRLIQTLLFTLRNLSDAATKQDNLDELLRQLIVLVSSPDNNIATCSAGVLSNLTCNNAKNKTIVCQLHGVEAFLKAINNSGDKEEMVERCVCSLRHITSRHPGAEMAQNAVREMNGIPMLMNLLQPKTRWPMIKALIGLFRNLALSHENHTILRDLGCIPKLWQLLNRASQESQRRGQQPGIPLGIVDGVSMSEVVDCSTAALHLLARDQYNRLIMRQLNVIPTFVQLLYTRHEGIQRSAVGALSELALDPEGAEQIEREGASTPLTDLLHSTNEGIAAYAAAVLFCLSEDKNLDPHRIPGELPHILRNEVVDSHGLPSGPIHHPFYSGTNPMLHQAAISRPSHIHYSNPGSHPGSIPGSQPFTPNMSEPPSGLMTPHSEFELPLDFEEFGNPGSGLHSGHHSGIHTPNHPHSGIHTPGHHSGIHTPNHHSGVHTPNHSGLHTPNHYHPHTTPPIQHAPPTHMPHPHNLGPGMVPGYHHIQHANYNPPSPALMDTGTVGTNWLDTDL